MLFNDSMAFATAIAFAKCVCVSACSESTTMTAHKLTARVAPFDRKGVYSGES